MEVHIPPKKKFMARFSRHEPIVMDHSAIIQAKKCKRKYFYRIVLGFVEKVTPQYFGFGSCYHKFRETLERQYASTPEADRKNMEARMAMFEVALKDARDLWKRKKMRDLPEGTSKWDFLTEGRLLKSCAVAFKHWIREKDAGRINVLAVEQSFIVPLPDGGLVAGKADQIVMQNGRVWGRDFKTSSKTQDMYYARTLDPNDQFTRYTWAESILAGLDTTKGQFIQGQIIEVLFNAKSTKKEEKGPEIHTHLATRAPSQIERWIEEQMFYNKLLTLMREEDCYPMEEASCSFCEYHSVCKAGSENAQMAKLESEFRQEPWDCTNRADMDDQ